jgi:hypothetical protein
MGSLLALSTRMASPNIRVCTRSVISMRASASTGEPMAAWGSPPRSCKNAWGSFNDRHDAGHLFAFVSARRRARRVCGG